MSGAFKYRNNLNANATPTMNEKESHTKNFPQ